MNGSAPGGSDWGPSSKRSAAPFEVLASISYDRHFGKRQVRTSDEVFLT